jgi:microcystin degradation protein MlrC
MVNDEAVVARAFEAGVGAKMLTTIGGSRDKARSSAVPVTALVRSLHDGSFLLEGPSMRKVGCNVGRTAVLSVGNIDVVAYSSMACTGDPQLFRHFGVEPTLYRIVIVKANTSFRAAYEKFAGRICLVDTGCAATSRLRDLPFQRLPKYFYPFSDEASPEQLNEVYVK